MRLTGPSRRRWLWAVAGMLLVTSGAGTGLWASNRGAEPVPVVVAGRDLPAGTVLAEDDVRIVHATGVEPLGLVDARATVVAGQRISVPVVEGAPLTANTLTGAGFPAPGEVVVAAAVAPGVLPDSAVPGAPVAVIITGASEDLAPAAGEEAVEGTEDDGAVAEPPVVGSRSVPARVHTIRGQADAASAQTVVELVVAANQAAAVAEAADADRIRLALVAEEGA